MSKPYNVLVFPCGSEIGLEVYRSLNNSIHFNLFGGNSVSDHGEYVFEKYIPGFPFYNTPEFIPFLKNIITQYQIDVIYPAMDAVITEIKRYEKELGIKVIAPDALVTEICLSKRKTYEKLKGVVDVPEIIQHSEFINNYPVFLKPDIGYGSRGTKKADDIAAVTEHLAHHKNCLILEYLPGREYTVDCFSDYKNKLLFVGPRERKRVMNGISVNTSTMLVDDRFNTIAKKINHVIGFSGAWFFQVKERADGSLVLLEIASRLGGSSSVHRIKGVNFAALSIFNAFETNVNIILNDYDVTLDRALDNVYKITLDFDVVYVDFDDTLVINGQVNTELIAFLYKCLNKSKKLILITKHANDIDLSLKRYKLESIFDEIIHLKKFEKKYNHCHLKNAIFIDDSFAERKEVKEFLNISVFSVDQIQGLII